LKGNDDIGVERFRWRRDSTSRNGNIHPTHKHDRLQTNKHISYTHTLPTLCPIPPPLSIQPFNSIPNPTNTPPSNPLIHIPTPPRPAHKLDIANPSSTPTPRAIHKLNIANPASTPTPTPCGPQIHYLDAAPTPAAVPTPTAVSMAWFFYVPDGSGLGASVPNRQHRFIPI
jgi:hypothetical protein